MERIEQELASGVSERSHDIWREDLNSIKQGVQLFSSSRFAETELPESSIQPGGTISFAPTSTKLLCTDQEKYKDTLSKNLNAPIGPQMELPDLESFVVSQIKVFVSDLADAIKAGNQDAINGDSSLEQLKFIFKHLKEKDADDIMNAANADLEKNNLVLGRAGNGDIWIGYRPSGNDSFKGAVLLRGSGVPTCS